MGQPTLTTVHDPNPNPPPHPQAARQPSAAQEAVEAVLFDLYNFFDVHMPDRLCLTERCTSPYATEGSNPRLAGLTLILTPTLTLTLTLTLTPTPTLTLTRTRLEPEPQH